MSDIYNNEGVKMKFTEPEMDQETNEIINEILDNRYSFHMYSYNHNSSKGWMHYRGNGDLINTEDDPVNERFDIFVDEYGVVYFTLNYK